MPPHNQRRVRQKVKTKMQKSERLYRAAASPVSPCRACSVQAPIAPKGREGDGGDGIAKADRPPASSAEPKAAWAPVPTCRSCALRELLCCAPSLLQVLQWVPPFHKARQPLHRSAERHSPSPVSEPPSVSYVRWPGPKVGWSELYELEVDLNLAALQQRTDSCRCVLRGA